MLLLLSTAPSNVAAELGFDLDLTWGTAATADEGHLYLNWHGTAGKQYQLQRLDGEDFPTGIPWPVPAELVPWQDIGSPIAGYGAGIRVLGYILPDAPSGDPVHAGSLVPSLFVTVQSLTTGGVLVSWAGAAQIYAGEISSAAPPVASVATASYDLFCLVGGQVTPAPGVDLSTPLTAEQEGRWAEIQTVMGAILDGSVPPLTGSIDEGGEAADPPPDDGRSYARQWRVKEIWPDTDKDGLYDWQELNGTTTAPSWWSNPFLIDTDGDGWSDAAEHGSGTDPSDAGDCPGTERDMWSQHIHPWVNPEPLSPDPDFVDLDLTDDGYPLDQTSFSVVEIEDVDPIDATTVLQTRSWYFKFHGRYEETSSPPMVTPYGEWDWESSGAVDSGTAPSAILTDDIMPALPNAAEAAAEDWYPPIPPGSGETPEDAMSATASMDRHHFVAEDGPQENSGLGWTHARFAIDQAAPPGGIEQRFIIVEHRLHITEPDQSQLGDPESLPYSSVALAAFDLSIPEGGLFATDIDNIVGDVSYVGAGTDVRVRLRPFAPTPAMPSAHEWLKTVQEMVQIEFTIYPAADTPLEEVLIPVDSEPTEFSIVLDTPAGNGVDSPRWNVTGGTVEISVVGDGATATPDVVMLDSHGVGRFTVTPTGEVNGPIHLEGRLQSFQWDGEDAHINCLPIEIKTRSDPIRFIEGAPDLQFTQSVSEMVADGHGTALFEATARDTKGNPLPDGTCVTWSVVGAPAEFAQDSAGQRMLQTQVQNGKTHATVRAPLGSGSMSVGVAVGSNSIVQQVAATEPQVVLTAPSSTLNIFHSETTTLTLQTDAADGTPVFFLTSNGSILDADTIVSGGRALATLTADATKAAREGAVAVIASVGQRLVSWAGNFVNTAPVRIELQDLDLIGGGGATTGTIHAPAHAGRTVHLFFQHGVVDVQPWADTPLAFPHRTSLGIGLQLNAEGKAYFRVTGLVEPVLSMTSALVAEVETGHVVEGVRQFEHAWTFVNLVNAQKAAAVGNFLAAGFGGDPVGGYGLAGSFVGGIFVISDIGVLGKNVARYFSWIPGDTDAFESALAAAGVLLTGNPLDVLPAAARVVLGALKQLPPGQADVAVRLLQATYKRCLRSSQEFAEVIAFLVRLSTDLPAAKAAFVAANGSWEGLRAVAASANLWGDDFLTYLKALPLNNADEMAAAGKVAKCLTDCGQPLLTAVVSSRRLNVLQEMQVILKGGTNVTEKIDPAALAMLLKRLSGPWITDGIKYQVTHFLNHTAAILRAKPGITGLLVKGGIVQTAGRQSVTSAFESVAGHFFHLQEAARRAPNLKSLEAGEGQFVDIILETGEKIEVKASKNALVGFLMDQGGAMYDEMARYLKGLVDANDDLDSSKLVYVVGKGFDNQGDDVPAKLVEEVAKLLPQLEWFRNVDFPEPSFFD